MRVVVTGMGVLTPIGCTISDFMDGLKKGRSGIDLIEQFDVSHLPSQMAGQVHGFDPLEFLDKREIKRTDRFSQFGLAATHQAWEDASLDEDLQSREDIGVYLGTGIGGIGTYEKIYDHITDKTNKFKDAVYSIPRIMNNAASSLIARKFSLFGPNLTVNTACSSGSNAIGLAFEEIQRGVRDINICGGTEAPLAAKFLETWSLMRVLSKNNASPEQASRPFDLHRDGLVMAEGAAILVLESLKSAMARGAHIHGEIVGYASNSNAGDLTHPELEGQVRVLKKALEKANINPENVDYINAHGTSTRSSDRVETEMIKNVFKEQAYGIPVSSIKSMIGHSMGAVSAIQCVATLLSLEHDFVPPTINYQTPDPECDLDYVPNQARNKIIETAIANAFGFGGNNSVLVMKKWKAETM